MTVTPIRDGVEPAVDVAREMRDFTWAKIDEYCQNAGRPPHSIAFVLLGSPIDGEGLSIAHSWSPADENTSRMHACATAALLLNLRASGA